MECNIWIHIIKEDLAIIRVVFDHVGETAGLELKSPRTGLKKDLLMKSCSILNTI